LQHKCFAAQPGKFFVTRHPWGRLPTRAAAAVRPPRRRADLTPSRPRYDGKLGELYGIYLRHLVLMVLTLGWSRFWGRTRSGAMCGTLRILGDRFEYRGRGIELSGFVWSCCCSACGAD
jgi:hypothetical protein